jgi:DNA polymerase-3 subunit epsilon
VGFDFSFVKKEFERIGHIYASDTLCTLRMARKLFPDLPSRSLGPLCEHLLIDITDRHRAAGDAEATVYLLKHILKTIEKDHSVKTWDELEKWLGPAKRRRRRVPAASSVLG